MTLPGHSISRVDGMDSEHLPSFRLDGRVAVVTGSSRGIGRGLVDAKLTSCGMESEMSEMSDFGG